MKDKKKASKHQLPAGTVLKEQYRIDGVIAQGGFGITYLGWDLYLDVAVAIKEYYPNGEVYRDCTHSTEVHTQSDELQKHFVSNKERFIREARILARFSDCREIVSIRNFFEENQTAYIVMEYVQGTTLKDYIKGKGGRISFEEAFALLAPVMRALAQVHESGVIHRDISPENIMILPEGNAKLLDFGAVRKVGHVDKEHELTVATEAIVKHSYAPLEQYLGRGQLGPWTDVYAFCALFYFCLTGELIPDAPERALGTEIPWENTTQYISDRLRETLQRGLSLRVEERTSDMTSLYEELEKCVQVRDPQAPPEPSLPKKQQLSNLTVKQDQKNNRNRRRTLITAAAAAAVAVCVLAAILLISNRNRNSSDDSQLADNDTQSNQTREALREGKCGDDVNYRFDPSTGVMELYGTGSTWQLQSDNADFSDWGEQVDCPWEEYKDQITKLVIGDGITCIGMFGFENCVNLTEVEWGSVSSIEHYAFSNTGLTAVTFPDSLNEILMGAFYNCGSLKEVNLPQNLVLLEDSVFVGCPLETVQVGSVTKVTDGDEYNSFCSNWNIPSGLTIYGYAGSSAEEVALKHGISFEAKPLDTETFTGQCGGSVYYEFDPDTGTLRIYGTGSTYDYDFSGWEQEYAQEDNHMDTAPPWLAYGSYIRHIVFEPGVVRAGMYAFRDLFNLEDVDFGEVNYIASFAFYQDGITELTLPESVTYVEDNAFCDCPELTKVTFLAEELTVSGQALNYSPSLSEVTVYGDITFEAFGDTEFFFEYELLSDFTNGAPTIYGRSGGKLQTLAEEYGCEFVELK
jgi:serine/threonine protein kinase